MQGEFSSDTGPAFNGGMTCEPFRLQGGMDKSISSAGDSLARISVMPGVDPASMANDLACGRSFSESFAWFDRDTSSWRTSQLCLDGGWDEFSATWPSSGVMRNGECFHRAEWVPHIHEKGCSLFPTPLASDGIRGGARKYTKANRKRHWTLNDELGARPNPPFSEWLIGFPIGWSDLRESEMRLIPMSPSGSVGES